MSQLIEKGLTIALHMAPVIALGPIFLFLAWLSVVRGREVYGRNETPAGWTPLAGRWLWYGLAAVFAAAGLVWLLLCVLSAWNEFVTVHD